MYQDKTLTCKDCGQEFVFTAGEQEFYAEKGFQNEPTRCKACRIARKNSRPANGEAQQREMYETTCPKCGNTIRFDYDQAASEQLDCPNCGAHLEFSLEDDDAE